MKTGKSPWKKTLGDRSGTMDLSMPLYIMAILGCISLSNIWDTLEDWAGIAGVAGIIIFVAAGIYQSIYGFKGFAHNAERLRRKEEKQRRKEDH